MARELRKRAKIFSGLFDESVRKYRCVRLKAERSEDDLFSRHKGISGFNQQVFSSSSIGIIGAGGLGGEIGEGVVRKGIGSVTFFDFDNVELSNLNRQYFFKRDIRKKKALRLSKNLSKLGFGGTRIEGVGMSFQQAVERNLVPPIKMLVCGVDNDETRVDVSHYGVCTGVPVIFTAVSIDGNNGMAFIQEAGKACYGCAFPDALNGSTNEEPDRCAPVSAVKDILKIAAGLVLYAIDSVLMGRKRNWNYRELFLAGFVGERSITIERRADCPICGQVICS